MESCSGFSPSLNLSHFTEQKVGTCELLVQPDSKFILLLDILVCGIAVYFYESKYKWRECTKNNY